jgi:hypothetical protein
LTPALNNTPHQAILERGNRVIVSAKITDSYTAIVEVIVDLILILIEELLSLGVVDETGDASGAAIVGYVLDLICIGEASSECIMHGHVCM